MSVNQDVASTLLSDLPRRETVRVSADITLGEVVRGVNNVSGPKSAIVLSRSRTMQHAVATSAYGT